MEEILQQILKRFDDIDYKFDSIDMKFDAMDKKFDAMDEKFDVMDKKFDAIDEKLDVMDKKFDVIDEKFDVMDKKFDVIDEKFDVMDSRLSSLEDGQKSLLNEQGEMRKEVAFYYGSLMKKLDETKLELSSELKHVSNIQKQHQDVLEILNERQQ